jgi:predicted RNA binding protein YcfA (HicA-like mRNA interferase family)
VPAFRNVRLDQAVSAFERAGGVTRRGKHVVIKMPNGQTLAFSGNRQPIKIGILRAMIKKAGLTEEQFVALLLG